MIYLDNSATTMPFKEVITSFVKVSESYYGNPSSLHGLGGEAEKLLTQSRSNVAKLLRVLPQEIVFTSGGSEGNNLAIKGSALFNQKRGRHIITTEIEHPSVSEACKQLIDFGFDVTFLPVSKEGFVSVSDVKDAIREDTILVSMVHVNNEIGSIQPIEDIGELLEAYPKVIFHVDHVQGVGKVPLDIKRAKVDLCTLSAHKFNGLKGTGVLYIRNGLKLSPLISGGNQEMELRSGTENVAGVVALSKALRLTLENSLKNIENMRTIKEKLLEGISSNPLITVNTPDENSAPHIINFSINGLRSEVFVHLLEEEGIIISTTSACSSKNNAPSKTLTAMKIAEKLARSAVRISLSYTNSLNEVDQILSAINKAINKLDKVMR